ncbi:sensor histidine kinase [Cryptosporangium phraense]|uniref:histidine kinase n=1 Tax=Cryptosporangium phraense TaxID=2593070 RepID=A0A545AS31_9ACTN|nr:HAMP domain-containing sensor histidine kinase [Cryptosporangium phraense]TQS43485.1 HAMP domain-containing histidine kinase [Cryptosporangium phraense]
MKGAVPLRRSLVVRLLATSLLIAVCASAATAWLSTELTRRAVTQERSRTLTSDTDVYDTLIEYAATHPDWSGAESTVRRLADLTGSRIALTDARRRVIAASPADAADAAAVSDVPTATVDPLSLDAGITRATGGLIDPRAVGPYRVSGADRQLLDKAAGALVSCLRKTGVAAEIVRTPSGRPRIQRVSADTEESGFCSGTALDTPVGAERAPLAALSAAVARCSGRTGLTVTPTFTIAGVEPNGEVQRCLDLERRAQLEPFVAPPALLFVTGVAAPATAAPLSARDVLGIVGTTVLVVLIAGVATVVAGRRLVRPLRTLTDAARRDVRRPVPVTTRDEIGYLAEAFNELSARREALERQRQDMVNDIAHELRTPLATIRAWLESARDGAVTVDDEVLDVLVEESILLNHVVDDLRDLAAADAGTLRVHPEPVYVRDLLEQLLDAQRAGTAVRLGLTADADPEVLVDPVRLRQIVGNLLSNAIRHTPAGGTVTVSLSVPPAPPGTAVPPARPGALEIAVTDTGAGIAPEDLSRIFDRFWRADTSRTRATGGSGLGLPIARQLARAHGGDLTATSAPGHGSTFTLTLPGAAL